MNDLLTGIASAPWHANLSLSARKYLAGLGISAPDTEPTQADLIWLHALATTYSPSYLSANGPAIRDGWPRIPLPNTANLLETSAALGKRLAVLLDPDAPAEGVTQGAIRPELATIAIPRTLLGAERDWHLSGYGTRTDKGITMPGRGRITSRPYTSAEAATAAHAPILGPTTNDIFISPASFWANIPDEVWNLHIGGYQVIKKWLSYRDASIIGRELTAKEITHIQSTARRLAAILLMGPELDAAHRACAEAHTPLPTPSETV